MIPVQEEQPVPKKAQLCFSKSPHCTLLQSLSLVASRPKVHASCRAMMPLTGPTGQGSLWASLPLPVLCVVSTGLFSGTLAGRSAGLEDPKSLPSHVCASMEMAEAGIWQHCHRCAHGLSSTAFLHTWTSYMRAPFWGLVSQDVTSLTLIQSTCFRLHTQLKHTQ